MDHESSTLALELLLRCRDLELEELFSFADALHDALRSDLSQGDVDDLWGGLWHLLDDWPDAEPTST
jgi:hypothetical protein